MSFIKKQMSWWRIVLIVAAAAIAIPIANGVRPTARAAAMEQQDYLNHQTTAHVEGAFANTRVVVDPGIAAPQDYYDRRREYWEKRVERRLDEEDGDDESGDDKEDADAKDNKAGKDDGDDEEDQVEQEIEQRRDYWRKRVERDW